MTRVFRRGELKAALLDALGEAGPANGYTIMQLVAERIGAPWQPSPGAIYPALLALEDNGLVSGRDRDGSRIYELSADGRRAVADARGTLDAVAARARTAPLPRPTLGALVDLFATTAPHRGRSLDEAGVRAVQTVLDDARSRLEHITDKET
jgi:DNA-binding PadR family transcriptional regulator